MDCHHLSLSIQYNRFFCFLKLFEFPFIQCNMTTPASERSGSLSEESVEKSLSLQHQLHKEDEELKSAPDGGARAWLVAAGGSCIFFCCLGFANSFGAFQEYYLRNQLRGESPQRIAWIGSLAVFLQFGAGVIGGPLFDRFGAKV